MPALDPERDRDLLQQMRNGSIAAFETIFELYWQRLYVHAKSKLSSHDEAEDVVQNIFSALWEKRQTLLITDLSYYLHTSVKNRILNLVRSKITQQKYWDYYKVFIPQVQPVTDNTVAFDDLQEAVGEAVSRLPEKSREVFKLSRMEGRSNAEIANLLNLSEKAIEYHLTRSFRELRVHLKDFMLVLPVGLLF
jgi:RNA polymerase sigma-70 factor (ECF subfamily)